MEATYAPAIVNADIDSFEGLLDCNPIANRVLEDEPFIYKKDPLIVNIRGQDQGDVCPEVPEDWEVSPIALQFTSLQDSNELRKRRLETAHGQSLGGPDEMNGKNLFSVLQSSGHSELKLNGDEVCPSIDFDLRELVNPSPKKYPQIKCHSPSNGRINPKPHRTSATGEELVQPVSGLVAQDDRDVSPLIGRSDCETRLPSPHVTLVSDKVQEVDLAKCTRNSILDVFGSGVGVVGGLNGTVHAQLGSVTNGLCLHVGDQKVDEIGRAHV